MGVTPFTMGFDIPLNELQELTGSKVALMVNIPPRDALAGGDSRMITEPATELVGSLGDTSRVLLSCGGMPPGVSTDNINTFLSTICRHAPKPADSGNELNLHNR